MEILKKQFFGIFLLTVISIGCSTSNTDQEAVRNLWDRHRIHYHSILCNGLDPADINGDGFWDYVTNYEDDGNIIISVHPGLEKVKEKWPTLTIGSVPSNESSCFGDFDGDGNPDVASGHGDQGEGGAYSGVLMYWHPGKEKVMDDEAWIEAGDIPESLNMGQYLFIRGKDINSDGALDIVIGGRRLGSVDKDDPNDPIVGLRWIEAPKAKSDRRDLSKWKVHPIDPDLISGHGFYLADVDGDGDTDVVNANNDWGTPEGGQYVMWYRNPGQDAAQNQQWERFNLYHGNDFYTKPGIICKDLDGDGRNDILTNVNNYIYYFHNEGGETPDFNLIKIEKPEYARWRTRPIQMADIDGNGKMDVCVGLIHHDGLLPADVASIMWMEYTGETPTADNWKFHVIKWGDGADLGRRFRGEKWDNFIFSDVDRDGDLDLVANCEEYTELGVEWFENPLK